MAMRSENYAQIKVTDVSCAPGADREQCCLQIARGFSFAFSMCMATCVICCWECTIKFEQIDEDTGPTLAERDYPSTSITNDGISFTTSQYGLFIPIVFGSDKLTGNVFWASPIEHIVRQRALSGGGVEDIYYRSLNFALGICEGEINGVLRMWLGDQLILDLTAKTDENGVMQPNADGFILGTTVDLSDADSPLRNLHAEERQTKISVFTGSETQLPEGVIVEAEGYENTPAYRGLAYVLFENFVIGRGSNVPNIFVEVTSNTDNTLPRLTGQLQSPQTYFDALGSNRGLIYDPSYDRIAAWAVDASPPPSPLAPGGLGFAIFDANTLEEIDQQEIVVTHGIPASAENMRLCARSGCYVFTANSGNQGIVYTYNPFSKSIVKQLGPGGGILGHSLSTGFGSLGPGATVLWAPGTDGIPTDIFAAVGLVNQAVGFAQIDAAGDITMVSVINNVIEPEGDADARATSTTIASTFSQTLFADGSPAHGTHLYIVSPSTNFMVRRFTIHGLGATVTSPKYSTIGTIPLADLAGVGFSHTLRQIFVDPVDQCLVLLISVATPRPDRIVKWSPFTGAIVWQTTIGRFAATSLNGRETVFLSKQVYAWIDSDNTIQQIDLATGELAPSTTLASDALPAMNAVQFYNGYEEAITYLSVTNQLVKAFLNRRTRQTVDLGDIVSLLCQRVGMLQTDIDRSDLDALTLHGYTIRSQKSLRECFSELGQAFKYDLIESNGKLLYKTRGDDAVETIHHQHLADTEKEGWLNIRKQNDIARIRKINLTYRDIDREYDNNVQSIILPRSSNAQNWDNDAAIDVSVPIVLDADTAKSLAEILLYSKLVYDTQYEGALSGRYINLDPGDVVDIQMDDDGDEIIRMRLRNMVIGADRKVKFESSQEDRDIYIDQVNLFGNVGRFETNQFNSFQPRIDAVTLPIPYRGEAEAAAEADKHVMYVALLNTKGTSQIPPGATIYADVGQRIILDAPDHYPTWGFVTVPPVYRTSKFSTDRISRLRVRIISDTGGALQSVTKADLLSDDRVNLCLVGDELLQYEVAEEISDGVWEFRNLHRGKWGTEHSAGSARAGHRFILIGDPEGTIDNAIQRFETPFGSSPRKTIQIFVTSNNPYQPAPLSFSVAVNYRPWAPSNVKRAYVGDDAVITWQRRARYGDNEMEDGSDAVALTAVAESYDIYLYRDPAVFSPSRPETYLRKAEVTSPAYTYTQANQTADGFVNNVDTLFMLVYQTGSVSGVDKGVARQTYLEPKV